MRTFSRSISTRCLERLGDAVCRHPARFIGSWVLLLALSLACAAQRFKLEADWNRVAGEEPRRRQATEQWRREFPGPEKLVVVVQSGSPERNREYVGRLSEMLAGETNLFHETDFGGLGPKGLLLVPEKDLRGLSDAVKANRPFIEKVAQATNLTSLYSLVNQQFLAAASRSREENEFMLKALLALQQVTEQARQSLLRTGKPPPPGVASLFGAGEAAGPRAYSVLDNGKVYVLTVRPRSEAVNFAAIARLRELIRQVEGEVPGLNVGLTGRAILEQDEMRQAARDAVRSSVAALAAGLLLCIFACRRPALALRVLLCAITGAGCTLGFGLLALGHFNLLTVSFAPILLGLAMAMGAYFLSREETERRRGMSGADAVQMTMVTAGRAIAGAAAVMAAAFFTMGLARFEGVREMGILLGAGVLLCLAPMLTMLPALLVNRGCEPVRREAVAAGHPLEMTGMRCPALLAFAMLALCAGAAVGASKVRFGNEALSWQGRGLDYEQALMRSASPSVLYVSVLARDAEEARVFESRLEKLDSVASVQSAADYFAGDARRKLELVREIKGELRGVEFAAADAQPVKLQELDATLWYLTGYLGLGAEAAAKEDAKLAEQLRSVRETVFQLRKAMDSGQGKAPEQLCRFQQAFFADLRDTFESLRRQDAGAPLRPEDLPAALRERFIGTSGMHLLEVRPRKDLWQPENLEEFVRDLKAAVPEGRLGGAPLELQQRNRLLADNHWQAAWQALMAAGIFLLWQWRSPARALSALLPMIVGGLWLLGFMGATGKVFSAANLMALPLLIGAGTGWATLVLREQESAWTGHGIARAVLAGGLMILAGFGSLMFAQHPGIAGLGMILAVGMGGCMLAAFTILPTLANWFSRRTGTAAAACVNDPRVPGGEGG